MRTVLRVTVWLCGILLFTVATVLGVNAVDQDLSPDAQRLLAPSIVRVPPAENLYVAMVGFNAPTDVQLAMAGQMRIEAHELDAKVQYPNTAPHPSFKGKANLCNPALVSCIETVQQHGTEVLQMAVDNVELYRRYLQLHELPRFSEAQSQSLDYLSMHVPTEVRNLFLTYTLWRVKNAADSGERAAALADLNRDIETWRRMLVGEGGLVSKMLAVSYLHADYGLLADVIGDPTIDVKPHAKDIEAMLDAVRMDDWQIPEVFEAEFRQMARLFDDLGAKKRQMMEGESTLSRYVNLGSSYFFLSNATQNLNAAHMRQWQQLARMEPRLYPTALLGMEQWRDDKLEFHAHWIYNPVGKILMAVSGPTYGEYILRAYDIAAYQQMVRVAYDLRMQSVPAERVHEHLERYPDLARHPVDGSAFHWMPDTGQLGLQPLSAQPRDRRFVVPVVLGA